MNSWRDDLLQALLCADSPEDLFKKIEERARAMGFEYCAYGIQTPVPISRPNVLIYSNYTAAWRTCYEARNYLEIDPTVRHARRSTLPVIWSNQLFEPARDMWEEARGHGLHVGWAQSARDQSGSVGLLTLARSVEQLSDAELYANEAKMVWLAQAAHVAMARTLLPKMLPSLKVGLTAREKEVMRWTAEGKTAYEIAHIIGVTERTVNFHINNVMVKLGVANKTQAAVKAALLGLLF